MYSLEFIPLFTFAVTVTLGSIRFSPFPPAKGELNVHSDVKVA